VVRVKVGFEYGTVVLKVGLDEAGSRVGGICGWSRIENEVWLVLGLGGRVMSMSGLERHLGLDVGVLT
jgi:hypothetical protein